MGVFSAGAQLAYLTHNRTFVASHMAEVDQEVATSLFSKTNGFSQSDSSQLDSKRQRKLNRMKAAREALGKEKTNNFMVIKDCQQKDEIKEIKPQHYCRTVSGLPVKSCVHLGGLSGVCLAW